jgi:hypothetical protein
MRRLTKKRLNTTHNLPTGWTTKDELLSILMSDENFVITWQSEEEIPLDAITSLRKLMFVKNGLQLTKWGRSLLMRSYISYEIPIDEPSTITGKVMINLDKIIKSPWHIYSSKLIIWDQAIYFEINMFNQNVKRYVDFYVPKIT